jgi:hypothetical protein
MIRDAIGAMVQAGASREAAMKRSTGFLFAVLLTVAVTPVIPAQTTAVETPVVAQELLKVRASNRVQAATWTRRPGAYTLHLLLHPLPLTDGRALKLVDGRRLTQVSATPAAAQSQPARQPEVAVWLLRADGTQLVTRMPRTTPPPESCVIRCNAIEIQYRFSIAEATQAVAAAIRIGDDFYIEKLEPLEQGRK